MELFVIRALLATRSITFSAVVVLLVVLAIWGRRVSYEQSISSFFAEDDPYMRVYQQAARTFGDDNFVFMVYDDPELLTPAGLDRVSELAAAVAPGRVEGVQRVESLDAMPLLWAVDARTAPLTVMALVFKSMFLIVRLAVLRARFRANTGKRSRASSASSTAQSKGMASSDSTRCTPSIRPGAMAAASSETRSRPAGVNSSGSS